MPKTCLHLRFLQTVQYVGEAEAAGNPSAGGKRGESVSKERWPFTSQVSVSVAEWK